MSTKKDNSVTPPLALSQEAAAVPPKAPERPDAAAAQLTVPPEKGGPKGPEPTRYGDWERKGRVSDF